VPTPTESVINAKSFAPSGNPSTGTNFVGMLQLATEMRQRGEQGSIVSLLCDSGERYLTRYFDPNWVQHHIGDCALAQKMLQTRIEASVP